MFKRFAAATALLFVATGVSIPAQGATTTKTAHVSTVSPAGNVRQGAEIRPFSTIAANVWIVDNGSSLTISGRGIGFNPNLQYTSFFYGTGSVARGSLACIPPTPNNLTPTQMTTAYWMPVGSAQRTLMVVNSGASYTPLSSIGTMSVRYDSAYTGGTIAPNAITPARFWLNSCGLVRATSDGANR